MNDPADEAGDSTLPLLITAEWLSFAHTLSPDNLQEVVLTASRRAAAAGFDGVEIPLPHAEPFAKTHDGAFWAGVAKQLDDEGMPIRTIHGPTYAPLDVPIEQAVERLRFTVEVATAMGAEVVVVHPTPHTHPHVTTIAKRLLQRDIEVTTAVAQTMAGPTRLAVENLPTYGIAHLERLMAEVTHDRVGVCFDTGHWSVRPEGTLAQAIERFAPRIIHWHLSDNDGWTDQHLPPGKGTIDWQQWCGALDARLSNLPKLIELSVPLLRDDPSAPEQALAHWRAARAGAAAAIGPFFPAIHSNFTTP